MEKKDHTKKWFNGFRVEVFEFLACLLSATGARVASRRSCFLLSLPVSYLKSLDIDCKTRIRTSGGRLIEIEAVKIFRWLLPTPPPPPPRAGRTLSRLCLFSPPEFDLDPHWPGLGGQGRVGVGGKGGLSKTGTWCYLDLNRVSARLGNQTLQDHGLSIFS